MSTRADSHHVAVLSYNNHSTTDACLRRVRDSGFTGAVELVDNGSDPPLTDIAARYGCLLTRYPANRYVNPVWNELFENIEAEYLTLLNNDCLVRDGYLDDVVRIMDEHTLSLAAPASIETPDIGRFNGSLARETAQPEICTDAIYSGHLMTLNLRDYRTCDYVIPSEYLIWCGDVWIWGQLRRSGYQCAVLESRTCIRETSGTLRRNPHFQSITTSEQDRAFSTPAMIELGVYAGLFPASAIADFEWRRTWQGRMYWLLRRNAGRLARTIGLSPRRTNGQRRCCAIRQRVD